MFVAFCLLNIGAMVLVITSEHPYVLLWERVVGTLGILAFMGVGYLIRRLSLTEAQSNFQIIRRKLLASKGAALGLIVVIATCYLALLAPMLAPYSPYALDFMQMSKPPSSLHWFGTDELGRDLLSRVIYGSRVAIAVGVAAVVLNISLGLTLGLVAGYFGGRVDNLIMRGIEIWSSIPFVLMAIAIIAAVGASITNIIIVVGITGLMDFTRIVRSAVIGEKSREYVEAAKALGVRDRAIIFKHILPNCLAPVTVLATLRVGSTILTVAGLSYLGLGAQPPIPSWGVMLNRGQEYLAVAPWMALFPGLAIVVTVMAFNLLGDGLRDALDPRLIR